MAKQAQKSEAVNAILWHPIVDKQAEVVKGGLKTHYGSFCPITKKLMR
ncbi:MAG: hypothetical protein AAF821_22620 [Cyanobacteria bacterium P01_D01_bin.156]